MIGAPLLLDVRRGGFGHYPTAHGGEIDVSSTAESGTAFTVRVPRAMTIAAPRKPPASLESGAAA